MAIELVSTRQPDKANYALGLMRDGNLHLTPVFNSEGPSCDVGPNNPLHETRLDTYEQERGRGRGRGRRRK